MKNGRKSPGFAAFFLLFPPQSLAIPRDFAEQCNVFKR
jgi:hypothetical protein